MNDREAIFSILKNVVDPEIPILSIEEMGILRDVTFQNGVCQVLITPTYTGCPAMGVIEQDIITSLHQQGVDAVEVKITYSPAWSTDWISSEAKQKMMDFGISPPVCSVKDFEKKGHLLNVVCPVCKSENTAVVSTFGSTACKSLYRCLDCKEPFDYFKCH